jgi:hypothetical protein
MLFRVDNDTKMTILSGGNVGIGTASPAQSLDTTGKIRVRDGGNTTIPSIQMGASGIDGLSLPATNTIAFITNSTERMRITSGGDVFSVSNTSGISSAITAGAGTSLAVFIGKHSATNGSYASGTNSFIVWSNGNVVNTNNSYGAISDAKLKENIVDTTPKLDDLMKVKVRNYNLIGDDKKQIGVVAQELEEVFPAMIDESIDYEDKEITDEEGNISTEKVDLGTTTKSVKYSVFVPMLIKSIQELKAEVELLKTQINN